MLGDSLADISTLSWKTATLPVSHGLASRAPRCLAGGWRWISMTPMDLHGSCSESHGLRSLTSMKSPGVGRPEVGTSARRPGSRSPEVSTSARRPGSRTPRGLDLGDRGSRYARRGRGLGGGAESVWSSRDGAGVKSTDPLRRPALLKLLRHELSLPVDSCLLSQLLAKVQSRSICRLFTPIASAISCTPRPAK